MVDSLRPTLQLRYRLTSNSGTTTSLQPVSLLVLTLSAPGHPHQGLHLRRPRHPDPALFAALRQAVCEDLSVELAKLADNINQRTEVAQRHISRDLFDLKRYVNTTADRTIKEAFCAIEEHLLPILGLTHVSATPGAVPTFTKPASPKLNKRLFEEDSAEAQDGQQVLFNCTESFFDGTVSCSIDVPFQVKQVSRDVTLRDLGPLIDVVGKLGQFHRKVFAHCLSECREQGLDQGSSSCCSCCG